MWDNDTTFSNRQTLSAGASDAVVDAGPDDLGLGEPVYLQVMLTGGAGGELTVAVETADAEVMTGAVELAAFKIPAATVAAGGTVLAAPLPTGCRRYLRLQYSGAAGGFVTAGLVQGAQTSGLRR
jgi:hypothetical protein